MARRRADPAECWSMAFGAAASGERRESAVAPAGSVRIATWNVNSASSACRCRPGWMSGGRRWSACRRTSSRTTRSSTCRRRARRAPVRRALGEPTWNGVAILSRVGLADVAVGSPARRVSPIQSARGVCTCGGIGSPPCTHRTGASGLEYDTSSPGWLRCGTWSPLAPRRRSYVAT